MPAALTVTHVLQWFELGGAESVALQLASRQVRAGHRVRAIALARPSGPLAAAFRERGVEIDEVPRRHDRFDPSLYPRLFGLFRRQRPQIVHTHDPQSLAYAAAAGKAAGARLVHTKHGADVAGGRSLWLLRGAALCLDAFVAVTEPMAQLARAQREVRESRIQVIENGVDLEAFAPAARSRMRERAALGVPADAWVIGTVGRLEPVKNQALLVRAARPLLEAGARLVIAGDGSLRQTLADLADEVAPAGVLLCGVHRDVPALLGTFDTFALPSDSEGLPLALLEAMAAGLPIVATAVGGVADVARDQQTALLVPAGDEAGLSAALARLRHEPELAARLGAAARREVERRYSVERTAQRYLELYQRLLERRR